MHACTLTVSKITFMINQHSIALKQSLKNNTNKMRTTLLRYTILGHFIKYKEKFNSATGKLSSEFIDIHLAVSYRASSTPSLKQILEVVTLYHKNCRTVENQMSANLSVKKNGLLQSIRTYESNTCRNGPH